MNVRLLFNMRNFVRDILFMLKDILWNGMCYAALFSCYYRGLLL